MNTPSLFHAAACIQYPVLPGEPEHNMERVRLLLARARPEAGTLALLPEMWATGFDYAKTTALAQRTPEVLEWMRRVAAEYGIFLAGSMIVADAANAASGLPRNMLCLVGPEGLIGARAKQHLFAPWQEDRFFQAGPGGPPLQTPFGPLAALVCYDLRFPDLASRQVFAGSSLLAVSAQWPLSRLDHWQALLKARAIENQVYVVAANGCGMSGQMELAGHSMLIAPDGEVMECAGAEEVLITRRLDSALDAEQRRRFYPAGERAWLVDDQEKICTTETLLAALQPIRQQGSRIAFTNGCFDILHAGHVSYLEQARRCADCLVVALNTDASVRMLKGPDRPVNGQADRARVLAALACVDYIVFFDEQTPLNLIRALLPDVLVKGADWPEERIVGAAEVKAAGGRVERIPFAYACSTTTIIEKIRAQPQRIPG